MEGRMMSLSGLILVYHADSGGWQALWDSTHKLLSPATYACSLCALTHGLCGEVGAWKSFRRRHPGVVTVMHRDEFRSGFPECAIRTPCVMQVADGSDLMEVLGTQSIAACIDVDGLIVQLERLLSVRA